MEDLVSPSSQTKPADDPTTVTTSVVTTASATVAVAKQVGKERQLNLTDIFSVTNRRRTTSTGTASSVLSPEEPPAFRDSKSREKKSKAAARPQRFTGQAHHP